MDGIGLFEYFDLKASATTHDYDQVKTTINVLTDNDNKSNDEPVNNALTSENHDNNNNIDNSEQFDINCQSMIFTSELHYTQYSAQGMLIQTSNNNIMDYPFSNLLKRNEGREATKKLTFYGKVLQGYPKLQSDKKSSIDFKSNF